MDYFEKGYKCDCNGEIVAALEWYAKSIQESENIIDAYLNSAVIYWLFAIDFGFRYKYSIDMGDIPVDSFQAWSDILEQGIKRFPKNRELQFWYRYILHINGEKNFSCEECKKLVSKKNLIPYFFLANYSDKYVKENEQLCESLKSAPTCKNKYVISICCPRKAKKLL